MLESLKENIEKVTRWKRPSRDDLRHAVKARKPNAFRFKDDGVVPNNRIRSSRGGVFFAM